MSASALHTLLAIAGETIARATTTSKACPGFDRGSISTSKCDRLGRAESQPPQNCALVLVSARHWGVIMGLSVSVQPRAEPSTVVADDSEGKQGSFNT